MSVRVVAGGGSGEVVGRVRPIGGDVVGVAEPDEVADLVQGRGLEVVAVEARAEDARGDEGWDEEEA